MSQTELEKLVHHYRGAPWDWEALSRNPRISTGFIERYPDFPWVWGKRGISFNPNVTIRFVELFPDQPWHWGQEGLSATLEPETIDAYPEKEWFWGAGGVSANLGVTLDFVSRHMDRGGDAYGDAYGDAFDFGKTPAVFDHLGDLSTNVSEDILDIIKAFPDKPWCWGYKGLSVNPRVTSRFVQYFKTKPWDWNFLACFNDSPSVTSEFVRDVTGKANLIESTEKYVRDCLDKKDLTAFSMNLLCIHNFMTPDTIDDYPDQEWDWYALSLNKNITPEFIEWNIEKPWNWIFLSTSPHLTFEFVKRRIDRCSFEVAFHDWKRIVFDPVWNCKASLVSKVLHLLPLFVKWCAREFLTDRNRYGYWDWKRLSENTFDPSTIRQTWKSNIAVWMYSGFVYDNLLKVPFDEFNLGLYVKYNDYTQCDDVLRSVRSAEGETG